MSLRAAIKRSLDDVAACKPATRVMNISATSTKSYDESKEVAGGAMTIVTPSPAKKTAPPNHRGRRPAASTSLRSPILFGSRNSSSSGVVVGSGMPNVILPKITKSIRNDDPGLIDEHGFVEAPALLSQTLVSDILSEAIRRISKRNEVLDDAREEEHSNNNNDDRRLRRGPKRRKRKAELSSSGVEEISNALQCDVSATLLDRMMDEVRTRPIVERTMRAVYGATAATTAAATANNTPELPGDDGPPASRYSGFVLETPKVLVTLPGSPPQHPHADDHCTSCVVCIVHLLDEQQPTRCAPFRTTNNDTTDATTTTTTTDDMDYPTGITVSCDNCNRQSMLPDVDYRRGVHLLPDETWTCAAGCDDDDGSSGSGNNNNKKHRPYDFEGRLIEKFGCLLDVDAPNMCDAYCGPASSTAGDGVLALPTLIHRGPGLASSATVDGRYVLFFTLRPLYHGAIDPVTSTGYRKYHIYNSELQIHAGCILYNQFKKVKSIYADSGCGIEGTFHSIVGLEAASQICKMKLLKEENVRLKEENRRLRHLEDNRRLKVEEHGVNTDAATMVNPSNEDELSMLQNQLTKKEFELKQLSSENDTLMMQLTEKQQQIKALEEYKTKSLMVEDETALLQDENIALMEKIDDEKDGRTFQSSSNVNSTSTS